VGLLAFFECSARIALRSSAIFDRVFGNDDSSWRLLWLRRADQRLLAYAFDAYHPTRGWALRPDLDVTNAFDGRQLSSNSRGVRGHEEYAYEKPADGKRIVVLGDSFTFGEDVADLETYAAQLHAIRSDVEVMNLGVHGYGHDQMLLYLKEEGVRYHPDVVVLGFVSWDMERNLLRFRDYAKPRFRLSGSGLILENTPVPTPREVTADEWSRSRLADLLYMLTQRAAAASGRAQAAAERTTAALLDEFARTTASAGAQLVLAFLPVEDEIRPGPPLSGEKFLLEYCRARQAHCIDVRNAFIERQSSGDRFRLVGHWNAREHRLAAEVIAADLARSGLLPTQTDVDPTLSLPARERGK
jgi:hypothetical protein